MAEGGKAQAFKELGSTGLKHWGGAIYEELLSELQGIRGVRKYEEMARNDPVIGAIMFTIRMLIRQVTWSVDAAGDEEGDEEAAEFLRTCLDDMEQSWEQTISDILSFLTYGWALTEVVYKRRLGASDDPTLNSRHDDGKVGWRKIAIRAQETLYCWDFSEEGQLVGFQQLPPPDYRLRQIPWERFLLFRTDSTKNNPEGISILRNCYRPWYFKKTIEEIEAIGIERDLAGLPVVYVPSTVLLGETEADRTTRQAFLNMLTNIRRDKQEGVMMPLSYDQAGNKEYDLALLSTGSRRQFDTSGVIERYSRQIAMTVLADFIMLGHEKVGSFALSQDKTNLFVMALKAWLDSIAQVFNRHAVPRLWQVNGWDTDRLPKLTYGQTEEATLQELGAFVSELAKVGVIVPDAELEQYLRRKADLPVPEDKEAAMDKMLSVYRSGGCEDEEA